MKRLLIGLGLLLVTPAFAVDPSPGCAREEIETSRRIDATIRVGDLDRKYIIDAPDSLVAGTPVPLLFDFHGWGHSAEGVWKVSAFKDLSPKHRFLTVYPDGLPVSLRVGQSRPGWQIRSTENNRDLAFTFAMLKHLEDNWCIDRDRVYSTGFSNGAYFSHILGCLHADRFAAIAPVGGGLPLSDCKPSRRVSVAIHHGTKDEIVPLEQAEQALATWRKANQCDAAKQEGNCATTECRDGSRIDYCQWDAGHTWPKPVTEKIWEFLSAATK